MPSPIALLARVCVLSIAAAALFASPAHAASPAQAVASLNALRAAHGLPATVAENPAWSQSCAAHVGYMRQNGVLTHAESATAPGYSADGAWAGRSSVLAYGTSLRFSTTENPWTNAPFHLFQLLHPGLATTGYAEQGGFACMVTLAGVAPVPGPPAVATYPGAGRTGVPASETASEGPFTPAEALGIGATTGPTLIAYATGMRGPRLAAASLTGPAGAVPIRWLDRTSAMAGPFLADGAMIVPVAPLAAATSYTASIAFRDATGATVSHTWTFTTAGARPPTGPPPVSPPPGGAGPSTPVPANRPGSWRFDASFPKAKRAVFLRMMKSGPALFRRLRDRLDGHTTIYGDARRACGGGLECAGTDRVRGRFAIHLDPRYVSMERWHVFALRHELAHVVQFSLGVELSDTSPLVRSFKRSKAWRSCFRMTTSARGPCVPRAEIFADEFARWALADRTLRSGYRVDSLLAAATFGRLLARQVASR